MSAQVSAPDWQRIAPHLDRALDIPPVERDTWIAELATTEPKIAQEVRELLERHARLDAQGFLADTPLTPREHSRINERVGAYTIERLLGRGGMGEVWLARRSDGRFEGQCAIKFLDPLATSPKVVDRFHREAQVLARLAHPNIARLLDAGSADTPYLALEFVDGERIDRYCESHALDIAARVRLFIAVVAAVAHAHSQLIVHRDLKPSNVLVTADGQVKLLDFGIAKLLSHDGGDEGVTRLEDVALTPEYAAPEQLLGEPPSTATDVYQLGLLLFTLLTKQAPRALTGSRAEKIRGALDGVLARASTVAKSNAKQLRGDLDAILEKALRPIAAERYATAQALQEELLRHLQNEPVHARRGAAWYHASRFMARHAIVLSAVATVLFAILVGAWLAMREASIARQEALKAQAVQTFLADVFLANRYDQPDPLKAQKTSARELLLIGARRIESALADAPEVKVEVLLTLGRLMHDLGLAEEAVQLHKNRITLLRTIRHDHPRLTEALLVLADAMATTSSLGDRDAVLAEAERIVAEDASATPALRAELHFQRAKTEQYRDWSSSAHHARLASALFQHHGPRSRAAESLRLEADAAIEMDDLETAERSLLASAAIARQLAEDRNRVLPKVELALAEIQAQRLKVAAADDSFRHAVQDAERLYGRDHIEYANAIHAYGGFLAQHSRSGEALDLLREAVAINLRVNGADETYYTPNFESLLGVVLVDHGLPEEAVSILNHAVAIKRSAGRTNLALAAFLHMAARAPQDTGDSRQASAYLDDARDITLAHGAESGRDLMRANQVERARLALRLNRADQAVRLLGLAGIHGAVAPNDRREFMYQLLLGEAQVHNGNWAAAAATVSAARSYIERLGLQKSLARELARCDMVDGIRYIAVGDTDAANRMFKRALEVRQAVLHARSPLISEAHLWLAQAQRNSDPRAADQHLQAAKRILAAHPAVAPQYASPLYRVVKR